MARCSCRQCKDRLDVEHATHSVRMVVATAGLCDRWTVGNDVELCNALLEAKGVACVPGSAFGAPTALRISYTCPTPQLAPGLERIREFFSELA